MPDEPSSPALTRRHLLLTAGSAGLLTSIAGCGGTNGRPPGENPYETVTPPSGNPDPNDDVTQPPSEPSAHIKHTTGDTDPIEALPRFDGEPATDLTQIRYGHPDERAAPVTVNEATVTVTFTARVVRDLDFTLYIRDRNNRFHERATTLTATDDTETFQDHELSFDVSGINLPRGAGGYLEIVFDDTHPGATTTRLFRRHQFVGVDHPDGTRWFNDDAINQMNYYEEDGDYIGTNPMGFCETEDHGSYRTVFLLCNTNVNDEVYGVATTVDKAFVDKYLSESDSWKRRHTFAWAVHFATQVSHLKDLAQKTHQAITDIGITDSYDRLQALGDLVQMIPYGSPVREPCPPIIILHETLGNCSQKTALMLGILRNNPWNIRSAAIDCMIQNTRHNTVGIDERDFDAGNRNLHWVDAEFSGSKITGDLPDTRYAFFEMTADTDLGDVSGAITDIGGVYDNPDFTARGYGSNTPPDY